MKRRLEEGELSSEEIQKLITLSKKARANIIEMTTLADSGHPGGALGRAEIDLLVYYGAKIDPKNPYQAGSDIIIDSAGHYSAGTYSSLAALGFIPEEEAAAQFRKAGSKYEGHVSHKVPGVWLDTGILGQGLSAAIGLSLANKLLSHEDVHLTVKMGDGEQNKGQIAEALRFAKKYCLDNITVVIDANQNQLSGQTDKIMPMNITEVYKAAGWRVMEIDGHNIKDCWNALRKAKQDGLTAIISHTTMGKGYPKIEGDYNYHGKPLSKEQAKEALHELGFKDRFPELESLRARQPSKEYAGRPIRIPEINRGEPTLHTKDTDCRTAWGKALTSIAEANTAPIAVVDCDLEGSVKTKEFREKFPSKFFQCGIMEHHAASMAGAMSLTGVLTFLADFGALSVDEMYQQHRMTAINDGNLKLISTHCGLDVGEDGKTHQALDYLALSMHPEWQTFIPADANQTDRMVRYMATHYGCMHLAMGRSKLPIIKRQGSSEPFFGKDYKFEPGKTDTLWHCGSDAVIFTYGNLAHKALKVAARLGSAGIGIKVMNVTTPMDPDHRAIAKSLSERTKLVITYEDHYIGRCLETSGMAPAIKSALYEGRIRPQIVCLGVRDYGMSGKPEEAYRTANLHEDAMCTLIWAMLKTNTNHP